MAVRARRRSTPMSARRQGGIGDAECERAYAIRMLIVGYCSASAPSGGRSRPASNDPAGPKSQSRDRESIPSCEQGAKTIS